MEEVKLKIDVEKMLDRRVGFKPLKMGRYYSAANNKEGLTYLGIIIR